MKLTPPLLVAIMIALAAPAAAQPGRAGNPSTPAKKNSPVLDPPMIFYLAKGEPDACGEGCSEWIAAEGRIEVGTAQRLRTFLTRLGKRKLPIFFHSPGGIGTTAIEMGRLLRAREMTAGVSETIPADCAGASEQACRALKQSGQVLASELRNVAGCSSACVFTLIGAKVRQVPPGARLGVHAAKLIVFRTDGSKINRSDERLVSYQRTRLAELNAQFRRYVQEMKIDVRLFDLLSKVPHENIHYLSRDEIVGFGIDTREVHEARWAALEVAPKQLWTTKYFVEAKTSSRKELRTSLIQVECAGPQRVRIAYLRGLGSGESGAKGAVKLAVNDRSVPLSAVSSALKLDSIETGVSFSVWTTYAAFELLEAAAARDYVEIVESDSANAALRTTKLSTAGLSQAIVGLRRRCGSTPDCSPSAAWTASTPSPNGTAGAPSPGWTTGAVLPNAGAQSPNWAAAASSPNCAAPSVTGR
jgi:hypothetical protein